MATEPPGAVPVARSQDDAASSWPTAAEAAVADPSAADVIDPLHPGLVRTGVVLAFLIGGPPLGTFLVAAPVLLLAGSAGGSLPFGNALLAALAIALASYLFGALPALLTGATAAWYWPQLRGWRAHARLGMVGFLSSLICLGIAFAVLSTQRDGIETFTMALLCSLPGFVGATLVSRLLQALRGG